MLKDFMARIDARLARHGTLGASLLKAVVGTAGLRVAHGVIGFVTAIVLAKMLRLSGYGAYAFVMSLVGFVSIPAELGVPGLAIRKIPTANARKDWGYMRGFIIWSHQIIGLMSILLAAAGVVVLSVWGHAFDSNKLTCMWLGLLLIPLVSLGSLRGAMLRGLRKVLLGQLPEQVIRPAALLVFILILYLAGFGFDSPVSAMAVQIASVVVAFAFGLVFFIKFRPHELKTATARFTKSIWLQSSIP